VSRPRLVWDPCKFVEILSPCHMLTRLCSVVFASAYRTSVLFTYTATDPSYSLAPTVGWTAIEMAAGIVSACLPTMLPALNVFLRVVGIKSQNGSSLRRSSMNPFSSKGNKSNVSRAETDGTAPTRDGRRVSATAFYRLPDENDSVVSGDCDKVLGPEGKAYQYTIKSLAPIGTGPDEESGDEIPLHGIQVERETTVVETKDRRSRP
jgi:hypothetical protein